VAFHTAATLAWNVKEPAQPPWARVAQLKVPVLVQMKLPCSFGRSSAPFTAADSCTFNAVCPQRQLSEFEGLKFVVISESPVRIGM